MTTTRTIAAMFSKAVSMEIDAHAPLDFDTIFDLAHDYVQPDSDDAVTEVEDLAGAVADMLDAARALA